MADPANNIRITKEDAERLRQDCLAQERRVLAAFDADYRREDR